MEKDELKSSEIFIMSSIVFETNKIREGWSLVYINEFY